jgi:Cu-Zn family superoxide dismutase
MKWKVLSVLFLPLMGFAESFNIELYSFADPNMPQSIGEVIVEDSEWGGVFIRPKLKDLPPGIHGFHIHAIPSCDHKMHEGKMEVAGAAGGHFDPNNTQKHLGPYGKGHLGDLPVLIVNSEGSANLPSLAPRLKASDFKGRSLMIHLGSDNYSDEPKPNGGGGNRLACGVGRQ